MVNPVGEIILALLDGARSTASLPELLCVNAKAQLDVFGVAVTLVDAEGQLQPLAASDQRAARAQDFQFELVEGPCLDVVSSGRVLQVTDVANDGGRWPAYSRELTGLGVGAVASFPLRVGGIRLGVLDVYGARAGQLSDEELASILHYVDAAVLILLHLQEFSTPTEGTTGWLDAGFSDSLRGHPEVHQATGMVSVQAGVGLAEALLLLRAHAYAEERSLVDVAVDVVNRNLRFDGAVDPGGPKG
jgi:hypothetical protein